MNRPSVFHAKTSCVSELGKSGDSGEGGGQRDGPKRCHLLTERIEPVDT